LVFVNFNELQSVTSFSLFLVSFVIHAARDANSGMNFRKYEAKPMNCRICFTLRGVGAFRRASTLQLPGRTLSSEISCPKYKIRRVKKWHFLIFSENPAVVNAVSTRSNFVNPSGTVWDVMIFQLSQGFANRTLEHGGRV
jgi:hypothetical protein